MNLLKKIKLLGKNYVGMPQRARATEEKKMSEILEEISANIGLVDDKIVDKIKQVKDEIAVLRANNQNLDDAQEAKLKKLEDWIGTYSAKFQSGSTITQDLQDLDTDLDNMLVKLNDSNSNIDSLNTALQNTKSLNSESSKLYRVLKNHDTNIEEIRTNLRFSLATRVIDKNVSLVTGNYFVAHLPRACYPIRVFVSLDTAAINGSDVEFNIKINSNTLESRSLNGATEFIIPKNNLHLIKNNNTSSANFYIGMPLVPRDSNFERGSKIEVEITDTGEGTSGTAAKGMTITFLFQGNTNMIPNINF